MYTRSNKIIIAIVAMTPVKFVFVYARKFDALFVFDEECTQANDGMLCCD